MIPKMQHGKTLFLKPSVAPRIVITTMLATVRFYNQLIFHADKINDKWAYWGLTPEF